MIFKRIILFFLIINISACSDFFELPQKADSKFVPKNLKKTFTGSERPVVFLDEAHNNFHTVDGRYQPFVQVLRSDGYIVKKNKYKFTLENLKNANVLVISNALHSKNTGNLDLPNYDAFRQEEIEAIYHWVKNGGSLFLIADHMPFPKAAESLAILFGFQFNNGYATDPDNELSIFRYSDGGILDHEIRNGMNKKENITKVRTFMGQAFFPPVNAKSILVFGKSTFSKMSDNSNPPTKSVGGWSQGATLEFHKGRIAVFGEAGMFTSQATEKSDDKIGFLSVGAEQNEQFLLNIMHWLSRII